MSIAVWRDFCAVAPSPELRERQRDELRQFRDGHGLPAAAAVDPARPSALARFRRRDDHPARRVPARHLLPQHQAGRGRARPTAGQVRVVVVLVDFPDHPMNENAAALRGSVLLHRRAPARQRHGVLQRGHRRPGGPRWRSGRPVPAHRRPCLVRQQQLRDRAADGHPARPAHGARRRRRRRSRPWTSGRTTTTATASSTRSSSSTPAPAERPPATPGTSGPTSGCCPAPYSTDSTQIFAYLTIPEDAKIGVCAHELGHLLFGFPDLYDTDDSSEGVGNWCLMGGGSWNGNGDIPAHPSAWCKIQQGWASEVNVTSPGRSRSPTSSQQDRPPPLARRAAGGGVLPRWRTGSAPGTTPTCPRAGLLVWHVDEAQADNSDENHYMVGLVQADGQRDLERGRNRGDAGDAYPGTSANTAFTSTRRPTRTPTPARTPRLDHRHLDLGADHDGDGLRQPFARPATGLGMSGSAVPAPLAKVSWPGRWLRSGLTCRHSSSWSARQAPEVADRSHSDAAPR